MNGLYFAYLTGRAGNNIALVAILDGVLTGIDGSTMKYEGTLKEKGGGGYTCTVVYVVPPNVALITGAPPLTEPMRVPLTFDLPANFWDGQVISIVTPLGPVNVKFERAHELRGSYGG